MEHTRSVGSSRTSYRNPPLRVVARDVQMRPSSSASLVFAPRLISAPQSAPKPPVPTLVSVVSSSIKADHEPTSHLEPPSLPTRPSAARQSSDIVRPLPKRRHHHSHEQPKKAHAEAETEAAADKPAPRRRSSRLLYIGAAIILLIGAVLAYRAYTLNNQVDAQVKKLQSTSSATSDGSGSSSSSLPTDIKPKDKNYLQNYKVAAALPRLLTIKKIGVTARVLQVGVDKDNQMGVPTTAYDVAWYNGSSRPGEMGAMIIDGHVQGVGGGAIFTNLKKLVAGDTVTVERGDGKVLNYTVAKVETVPVDKVDMGSLLVSVDTSKPGLNLITCGGNYDTKSDSFDSRTIVYSVQQ